MNPIKILILFLTCSLIVIHYKKSKLKSQIHNIRIETIRNKNILKHKKILLSKLSHPDRLSELCKKHIKYQPTHVGQFLK